MASLFEIVVFERRYVSFVGIFTPFDVLYSSKSIIRSDSRVSLFSHDSQHCEFFRTENMDISVSHFATQAIR